MFKVFKKLDWHTVIFRFCIILTGFWTLFLIGVVIDIVHYFRNGHSLW